MNSDDIDFSSKDVDYFRQKSQRLREELLRMPLSDSSYFLLKKTEDKINSRLSELSASHFLAEREDLRKKLTEPGVGKSNIQKQIESQPVAWKKTDSKEDEWPAIEEEKLTPKEAHFVSTYLRLDKEGRLNHRQLGRELDIQPHEARRVMAKAKRMGIVLPGMIKAPRENGLLASESRLVNKINELSKTGSLNREKLAEELGIKEQTLYKVLLGMEKKGVEIPFGKALSVDHEKIRIQLLANKGKKLNDIILTKNQAELYSAMELLSKENMVERKAVKEHILKMSDRKMVRNEIQMARSRLAKKGIQLPIAYNRGKKK